MEQPDKESGIVQLDRQVEGDWLLVDHSQVAHIPGKKHNSNDKELDSAQFESGGVAYLDDQEDFRGYSKKSDGSEQLERRETMDTMGQFFRNTGGTMKKKY